MPINGYLGGVISATAPTVNSGVASGIFTLEEQMQAAGQGNWPGYQISRSVRTRASASAYFNRTPASASNQKTWTWSGWVKRSNLSSMQTIFGAYNSSTGDLVDFGLFTPGSSVPAFWCRRYNSGAGSNSWVMESTSLYRDPSAWYHVVFHLNCTSSPTFRAWINGVELTAWTQNSPPTNSNWEVNGAYPHYLGSFTTGQYFDGYLTEINFIDGQALTPTSFGATDVITGVWNPIKYTGTYGTNGFYLNFSDNSAATATTIGKDYSGNGNNWTPNNISVTAGTTYDSMVDVPIGYGSDTGVGGELRGNYATFSAVDYFGSPGLSEANLTISGTNPGDFGTIKLTSGKWYFEFRKNADGDNQLGIASGNAYQSSGNLGTTCFRRTWRDNVGSPSWLTDSGTPGSGTAQSLTTGDILGVALDLDNNAVYFAKNNTWMNSGVPTSGSSKTGAIWTDLSGGTWQIYAGGNSNGCYTTLNAGQRPFTYTAPSGFKVFCTQNLSTPTIRNGANYNAATLYTGTGASLTVSNAVNSISFQPDLVWIKSRSAATDNKLTDSVRGATIALVSNSTAAETTDSTGLTAFGSSGFTVGASTTYNNSGATYVGWQWKGGGTAVSNAAGSITSSVSANTTAGFSVVGYTGSGSNATVGHGLGVTPSMVITHRRASADGWVTYHTSLTSGAYILSLQSTNAQASSPTVYNSMTTLNSTVYSVGTDTSTNTSSATYIAYCFAAISGYSAFGSYTGNGSTDGPFVFTNMRPRWLMVKPYSGGTGEWPLIDSSRGAYNVASPELYASLAQADTSSNMFDLLSNGFKSRSTNANCNASGVLYIYAAFAENPFTISRAR
jgi:hypothetical protein